MANDAISGVMGKFMADMEERRRNEEAEWEALPAEEKARILAERKAKAEAEALKRKIEHYNAIGITNRYYNATWENWIADTKEKKDAIDAVRNNAWTTNLFLYGNNGTGKTHLAMCLTKEGAVYGRLSDICRRIRHNFDDEEAILNSLGKCKLLIIDEIGRQKASDFEYNTLFEIIDRRWDNVLPTTLITNFSLKEFSERYGTAVLDRLHAYRVQFTWESYREPLALPNPETHDDIVF
jgi:DNA replication protein DnaC